MLIATWSRRMSPVYEVGMGRRKENARTSSLPATSRGCHSRRVSLGRVALVIASSVGAISCSALTGFPASEEERSRSQCLDGVDNDFDGRLDCLDPSCPCNDCGDYLDEAPFEDALGQSCFRSCECLDSDSACNRSARLQADTSTIGRCSASVDPGADAFDVHFIADFADGRVGSIQNVFGEARFNGEVQPLTWMEFDGLSIRFSEHPSDRVQRGVVARVAPALRPEIVPSGGVAIGDEIEEGSDVQTLVASYGLQGGGSSDAPLGPLALAVIQTSSLTLNEFRVDGDTYVEGRFVGRLRDVAAIDRARLVDCGDDRVFDPLSSRCTEIRGARFFLGCTTDPDRFEAGGGVVAYGWDPWRPTWPRKSLFGGEGDCIARRSEEVYEIRARGRDWLMQLEIDAERLGQNTGFTDVVPQMWRLVPGNRDVPAFELDLGEPERVFEGQVWVDVFDPSRIGRVLLWLQGELRRPDL